MADSIQGIEFFQLMVCMTLRIHLLNIGWTGVDVDELTHQEVLKLAKRNRRKINLVVERTGPPRTQNNAINIYVS